jgi:GGDEF domain-containing protein
MTSTVGLAIYPGHGTSLDELLEEADADMFRNQAQRPLGAEDHSSAD